jgi:pimeloyl-ACP methyl ester carboxylesterase
MAFTEVGGVKLAYELDGAGPTLIQLHGLLLARGNFSYLTPLLRRSLTVLDYDMAGFGESDKPPHLYSLDEWAEEAVGLMDRLDIPSAHVHANASAGHVGLLLAVRHPERVRRLVVTSSFGRYDTMARVASATKRAVAREMGLGATLTNLLALEMFTREFFDSPEAENKLTAMRERFAMLDPRMWDHVQELRENADAAALLSRVAAPTMFMVGEHDVQTPVDAGPTGIGMQEMARRVPNGRLEILEGYGHLILVEAAEECARRITEFLLEDEFALTVPTG